MQNKDSLFGKKDDTVAGPVSGGLTPAASVPSPAVERAGGWHSGPDGGRGHLSASSAAGAALRPGSFADKTEEVTGSKLIVGPDIKLKGVEITDCDTLVVEGRGRVEASMDSRVIQIAEGGTFNGTATMDVAEIWGSFEGTLTARKQLVIYATGRVSGTIQYGKIRIEEGGELSGHVSAGTAVPKKT